jgi:DNA-binding LacI/PurR family transcriptional regulator
MSHGATAPPSKARAKSLVTIDAVAEVAGVSIATVSRVLNQTMPVGEETASRVLAAVEMLGYIPRPTREREGGML